MSAIEERIRQDIWKLERLCIESSNRVRIINTTGRPIDRIHLKLKYRTAPQKDYPRRIQDETQLVIQLLKRYPLVEPKTTIQTPIFHPNVYGNGNICLGTKWLPTHGLDLLVKRIIRLIIFDPTIMNTRSPANRDALSWYQKAVKKYPNAFPTDKIHLKVTNKAEEKNISWKNFENPNIRWKDDDKKLSGKTIIACPFCDTKNRIPIGKKGYFKCGRCRKSFYKQT